MLSRTNRQQERAAGRGQPGRISTRARRHVGAVLWRAWVSALTRRQLAPTSCVVSRARLRRITGRPLARGRAPRLIRAHLVQHDRAHSAAVRQGRGLDHQSALNQLEPEMQLDRRAVIEALDDERSTASQFD